ncbi:MAG: pyridoxine 5'-phosphate synthase [Bacteroidales bacterium]|jgi:pyridoxine 5-phosphate synthase|nr:pyridoxine 5'-phosphate synthase [Bacteroidales bacterium]
MTKLSVNINKVATIRNARGGNLPDVVKFAIDCEKFGAQGITVHPRPDERHIRYADVRELKKVVTTEFNIEGNPVPSFVKLVTEVVPTQVTLVPDAENVLTSNAGWDTVKHFDFLKDTVAMFQSYGIRVSIFIDPDPLRIEKAKEIGTDRVELYTESYASHYAENREQAIAKFVEAAQVAHNVGLGLNAGHDLNLDNLEYFKRRIPFLDEVSIGHAVISDALYLGIHETIRQYLNCLK